MPVRSTIHLSNASSCAVVVSVASENTQEASRSAQTIMPQGPYTGGDTHGQCARECDAYRARDQAAPPAPAAEAPRTASDSSEVADTKMINHMSGATTVTRRGMAGTDGETTGRRQRGLDRAGLQRVGDTEFVVGMCAKAHHAPSVVPRPVGRYWIEAAGT